MKNLIVVGDSFCSSAMYWPTTVAQNLNLNLICYTQGGGQPWWNARQWLVKLEPSVLDNTDIIIFAHTNAERIPTSNQQIGFVNRNKPPSTEIETAIRLYYKYINEPEFLHWAYLAWFQEITKTYGHKFLVHLHCFPWTIEHTDLLTGINITTNLRSLSLNEIGAESYVRMHNDVRPNHLNIHNNQELGLQLSQIIARGQTGNHALDTTKFDLKTTH